MSSWLTTTIVCNTVGHIDHNLLMPDYPCFSMKIYANKLTFAAVELIWTIPTVISAVAAVLLRNAFVILTRYLSDVTSTLENKRNVWTKWSPAVFLWITPSLSKTSRTTVHLVCAVSTVINAVTLPEHGLTQAIFTRDILWVALWEGRRI